MDDYSGHSGPGSERGDRPGHHERHIHFLPKRLERRREQKRSKRARWVGVVGVVLGVLVALGGFSLLARNTYRVGPATVSASAWVWWRGTTVLRLPPFGTVEAHTHLSPLTVQLQLGDVDVQELQGIATQGVPGAETLEQLRGRLIAGAQEAAARGLAAGVALAAFVAWAITRSGRRAAVAALVSAGLLGAIMGATIVGYEEAAFREPRFEGALAYAPGLIGIVQNRAEDVRALEAEIGGWARDLANYYASPQSFAVGGNLPGTIRVLHVTDIHLDPIGLRLARDLARSFDVRFVVDTGDINNLGTFPEGLAVVNSVNVGVPRVFVGGNHDSPEIVKALRATEGVIVLDETSATVAGFKVYGVGDPASRGLVPDATPDPVYAGRIAEGAASSLSTQIASGETTPDIVAAHSPAMVPAFAGTVPVILDGHLHTASIEQVDGTWVINSGTTGGVAFRGLEPDPHIPHTASILYFTDTEPRRLIAIDRVEVFGQETQTSLTRRVIDESLLPTQGPGPTSAPEATGTSPPDGER